MTNRKKEKKGKKGKRAKEKRKFYAGKKKGMKGLVKGKVGDEVFR